MLKNQGEYFIEYSNDKLEATINCLTLQKIKMIKVKKSEDIFEATNKVVRAFESAIEKKIEILKRKKTIELAKKLYKIATFFRKKLQNNEVEKYTLEKFKFELKQKVEKLTTDQSVVNDLIKITLEAL